MFWKRAMRLNYFFIGPNIICTNCKKVMIVNTASKCGLTYQYEALQNLYAQFKDNNFIIVGFPSNDFLWQEPGKNEYIIEFCEENYGVTFPMMSKITVKGSKKHPIYQFLPQKSKNKFKDSFYLEIQRHNDQNEIGWDHFLKGRICKQWIELQDYHCINNGIQPKYHGFQWATNIIKKIYNFYFLL